MRVNEYCGVIFFLLFDRVSSLVGRLSKLRPRDSESESVSSTYTKSELFAEEKSKEQVESFREGESGILSTMWEGVLRISSATEGKGLHF